MKINLNSFQAIFWVITFETISYFMGLITRDNMHWYGLLQKSILTPKGYVFSIIWPILYVLLAISGYLLYQSRDKREIKQLSSIFLIHMLFNWIWTPVFFGLHQLNLALVILVITIILTTYIMIRSFKYCRSVAYLLLPYLCWILFAGYLNFVICIIN